MGCRLRACAPARLGWALGLIGVLGLLGACAVPLPVTSAPAAVACDGSPECPIEVRLVRGSAADGSATVLLQGELTPGRPSVSYAFEAPAGSRLQWRLQGPAVRTVLTRPDGETLGPGLPPDLPLPVAGRHVFSLSSNTMAEGIYGPFQLVLRLQLPQ